MGQIKGIARQEKLKEMLMMGKIEYQHKSRDCNYC